MSTKVLEALDAAKRFRELSLYECHCEEDIGITCMACQDMELIEEALTSLRPSPPAPTTLRAAVAWFAQQMEEALRRNDHKDGWNEDQSMWLLRRLEEETKELHEEVQPVGPSAVIRVNKERVIQEAADVANFTMMIADNHGPQHGSVRAKPESAPPAPSELVEAGEAMKHWAGRYVKEVHMRPEVHARRPIPEDAVLTALNEAMDTWDRTKSSQPFPSAQLGLIEAMRHVEVEHFRTEHDTGANSSVMMIWNVLREQVGLPRLRKTDLPQWNPETRKYELPPESKLLTASIPPQPSPWISVETRLPEDNKAIVLCHGTGGRFFTALFTENVFVTHDDYEADGVTLWMPLPPTPEQR